MLRRASGECVVTIELEVRIGDLNILAHISCSCSCMHPHPHPPQRSPRNRILHLLVPFRCLLLGHFLPVPGLVTNHPTPPRDFRLLPLVILHLPFIIVVKLLMWEGAGVEVLREFLEVLLKLPLRACEGGDLLDLAHPRFEGSLVLVVLVVLDDASGAKGVLGGSRGGGGGGFVLFALLLLLFLCDDES